MILTFSYVAAYVNINFLLNAIFKTIICYSILISKQKIILRDKWHINLHYDLTST